MKSGSSPIATAFIVLATIGLATAPVIVDQFRTEVARWYLAEATNRIVAGRDNSHQVEQAGRWVEDLASLRDYWIFRAEQAFASSHGEVASVISQAVEADKANFSLAKPYWERLTEGRHFTEAVDVLKAGQIPELANDSQLLTEYLNNLAYFRSLAGIDLDQALTEIELALKFAPKSPGLRDTRAWVLFQMGKPQLALEDADFAVTAVTSPQGDDVVGWFDQTMMWIEQTVLTPRSPKSDGEEVKQLTRREAGEQLWMVGTLFYHRAKILEALGRTAEANQDLQWLLDHNLPTDGSLF